MNNIQSNKSTTKNPSNETTKTATSNSNRTILSDNTSIYFKHFGNQCGKLRLSLLNISNSILHFKFKKSSGTKLSIEPQASGIIEKHSETIITITWDVKVSEQLTPDGWSYVKMVLFLAVDGKFDDLDNCSLTRVVGYLKPNAEIFNENVDADVLVVDIPNKTNSLRQKLSRTQIISPSKRVFFFYFSSI
ncbi:hypothetical protein Mgra_00004610 [Meloidogyne graminicola]|uniref:Major sperm protein n=1 Tax=Meloidogyne graminicola TaxID=189291 RepID=A0A8S9ZRM5_9BILA|nr:hypothetical protein Mgra_00004610 [Meloidogyne graminicola]